ncbi:MAG: hotdog fold thioesterase [Bifidobacteriaceae bacterium]|jgi:uncharacterized protein (TIGR00369 family)|nr:hotdog fold thioesterase [Bifidobacteriaceae bacterium]
MSNGQPRDDAVAASQRIKLGALDIKLGIVLVEVSVDRVVATMPVAGNTQAYGRLHGGASLALGEFLGSWGAALWAARMGRSVVGLDINATHVRPAHAGRVTGVATPLHLGRRVTSHSVAISDEDGQLVSTIRITNLLIDPSEQ